MNETKTEIDFSVSKISTSRLDDIAVNEAGIVGVLEAGSGYVRKENLPERLSGGWGVKWIATGNRPDAGKLVLYPRNERTRALFCEGQSKVFMAAGLSQAHASALAASRARFKHELIEDLVDVLKSDAMINIYRQHPLDSSDSRRDWSRRYAGAIIKLPLSREIELARMVQELV